MRSWTLVLAVVLVSCGPSEEDARGETESSAADFQFRNVQGGAAVFVGPEACASCHEDLYASYQDHGMAQSYYPMDAEHAVEAFPSPVISDPSSDLEYQVVRDGDRFLQIETLRTAEGAIIHRLERSMDYVMGSGNAARTYFADYDGWLYQLPITWYSRDEVWAFSPGYEVGNKRFDRTVPDRCMACHNGYPESVPFTDGRYEQVPEGIGCERCHGPGSLHVEEQLAFPDTAGVDDSIVNPRYLSTSLQMDVCQQCHTNGQVSVLRAGRTAFDYRPSEPLEEYVAIYADPETAGEFGVISHAERLSQSACFIEADVTCTTCHNPHEGFRDRGPEYFDVSCASCHESSSFAALPPALAESHVVGADCASCHMPKVASDEAPHASFTDHWIRVVREEEQIRVQPAHDRYRLTPYFEGDRTGVAADRYAGVARIIQGTQTGDVDEIRSGIALVEGYLKTHTDDGAAHFHVGAARNQLGEFVAAIPHLERAVEDDPDIPERLNALAQAYEAERRDPATIERLYRRALTVQPSLAGVALNLGRFLESRQRGNDALAVYQEAIATQPWLAAAHYNLGTALLRSGAFEEGIEALGEATSLDPFYVTAWSNMGIAYDQLGQPVKALQAFTRAVQANPDDATALGNLGAFYIRADDLGQASPLLERSVNADPGYVDGWVNLALARLRSNQLTAAREAATRALSLDPANALARQILDAAR